MLEFAFAVGDGVIEDMMKEDNDIEESIRGFVDSCCQDVGMTGIRRSFVVSEYLLTAFRTCDQTILESRWESEVNVEAAKTMHI